MKFVETGDLRPQMRLACPVYDKSGAVLFDRDVKLDSRAVGCVNQLGLLGVYVLEPAEPLPPMSEEDVELERFQAAMAGSLQEELEQIISGARQNRLESVVSAILKKYGHLDGKIHFSQCLRGRDDFVCRHALNTAILTAMITHVMNLRVDEQLQCMYAAVLHDIGKLLIPKEILFDRENESARQERLYQGQLSGLDVFETAVRDGAAVKRICTQALRLQWGLDLPGGSKDSGKLLTGAKVLLVANRYDEITAMTPQGAVESEVKAIRELEDNPQLYDPEVVTALLKSVNVLGPGVSVELSTGEQALIVTENPRDALRPVVLTFGDNTLLDLGGRENRDIAIVDVSKTMDSRYRMGSGPMGKDQPADG